MSEFVKRCPSAPDGFFACEAAGLRWLASVGGGAACVEVLAQDGDSLTVRRLRSVPPTRQAAHDFGAKLAVTHNAGAAAFGAAPDGWTGPGFFGPMAQPLPMSLRGHPSWGEFYGRERLRPMAELAGPALSSAARHSTDAVIRRCEAGEFDDDDGPARLHGDLWSGNLMWTPAGAVLIDPAAHGGHRETDLAMLALFGCPYFDDMLAGYRRVHRLRAGWQDRLGLHQLYPLLVHAVLFGGGYSGRVASTAAQLVS